MRHSPHVHRPLRLVALAAALLGSFAGQAPHEPATEARKSPIAVCFAPGTSQSYMDSVRCQIEEALPDIAFYQASDNDRWSTTATDGSGLRQGDPTTLTWGIVPDGTSIGSFGGEGAAPSNLRAMLDDIYGNEATWLPVFQAMFDRWSEVSGVTYVHESQDDGASLGFNGGRLGVRPDVRIGGHRIDGNSGTLAYNFFPNSSDMVIDTADNYYRNTGSNSLRLRNVLSHEHGHGLGMDHVCPINGTKLMEPLAGDDFDGPQLDDVLAGQRLYGDSQEPNDSAARAADIGDPGTFKKVELLSIDGDDDVDYYAFTASAGATADVALRPVGDTYNQGPQQGGCGSGTSYDSLRRLDLEVSLLGRDGTTVLAGASGAPEGQAEVLPGIALPDGAGTYYVRVEGDGTDDVQLYSLEVGLTAGAPGAVPVAVDDVRAVSEDSPARVDVLANDTAADDVTVFVSSAPAHGDTSVNGDGSITYQPAPNYVGPDEFEYTLRGAGGDESAATVTISVVDSPRAGFAKVDSDEDMYPDELESAVGTAPDNVASVPADAAPEPLTVVRGRFNLSFSRRGRDRVVLRTRVPVPEGFEVDGAQITVYVGGVARDFALNARGWAGARAPDRARLLVRRARGSVPAQDATLNVMIRRQDLAAQWADEGLTGETRLRREYREATIFVLVNGAPYELTIPLRYNAIPNRRGWANLIRE